MNDEISYILREHVSFRNDLVLRRWMLERLDISENAENLEKVFEDLERLYEDLSQSTDLLYKAPYCALLLYHVRYKLDDYLGAAKRAGNAITVGFGSGGEPQNLIVSFWLRALANERANHIEDAFKDVTESIKLVATKLDDCKRSINKQGEQKEYNRLVRPLNEIRDRLQKKFRNNIPAVRPPPADPNEQPSSVSNRNRGDGTGNIEGKHSASSRAPRIEVNVPIDISLSNSMKAAVSSEAESPVDVNAIIVNDARSLASADAVSLNLRLPAEKSDLHDTDLPIQEGEIVEEMLLPWLPDLIGVEAQADPDGSHLHIKAHTEKPTKISHIIIEDKICTIHSVKRTAKIDRIIKLSSSGKYAWIRVTHDSMKDFEPPIEEGDYILYYDWDVLPHETSVVVVREINETGEDARVLVKQYRNTDNHLYSYNNEKKYKPRPLCEQCRIVGIVVAVAKPNNREKKD